MPAPTTRCAILHRGATAAHVRSSHNALRTLPRAIIRDVHEDARDHARSFVGTPEFERSGDERKEVEMRFAHFKTHHRFERLRLRGLSEARDEFHHLAAIVQTLKTLASQLWQPPPGSCRQYV